jgi:hypothetical protein
VSIWAEESRLLARGITPFIEFRVDVIELHRQKVSAKQRIRQWAPVKNGQVTMTAHKIAAKLSTIETT